MFSGHCTTAMPLWSNEQALASQELTRCWSPTTQTYQKALVCYHQNSWCAIVASGTIAHCGVQAMETASWKDNKTAVKLCDKPPTSHPLSPITTIDSGSFSLLSSSVFGTAVITTLESVWMSLPRIASRKSVRLIGFPSCRCTQSNSATLLNIQTLDIQ